MDSEHATPEVAAAETSKIVAPTKGWAEALDTFADIIWPTLIAAAVLGVAVYATVRHMLDVLRTS